MDEYIFLIVFGEKDLSVKDGKILLNCINDLFRKHGGEINMNPGRSMTAVALNFFPISGRYLRREYRDTDIKKHF